MLKSSLLKGSRNLLKFGWQVSNLLIFLGNLVGQGKDEKGMTWKLKKKSVKIWWGQYPLVLYASAPLHYSINMINDIMNYKNKWPTTPVPTSFSYQVENFVELYGINNLNYYLSGAVCPSEWVSFCKKTLLNGCTYQKMLV